MTVRSILFSSPSMKSTLLAKEVQAVIKNLNTEERKQTLDSICAILITNYHYFIDAASSVTLVQMS